MKLEEQYRILEFDEFGDERGSLVVAEGGGQDIPFEIKRVFYMYGSDPTIVRGQHANRKTEFVLINVSGTSKVKVDLRTVAAWTIVVKRRSSVVSTPRITLPISR